MTKWMGRGANKSDAVQNRGHKNIARTCDERAQIEKELMNRLASIQEEKKSKEDYLQATIEGHELHITHLQRYAREAEERFDFADREWNKKEQELTAKSEELHIKIREQEKLLAAASKREEELQTTIRRQETRILQLEKEVQNRVGTGVANGMISTTSPKCSASDLAMPQDRIKASPHIEVEHLLPAIESAVRPERKEEEQDLGVVAAPLLVSCATPIDAASIKQSISETMLSKPDGEKMDNKDKTENAKMRKSERLMDWQLPPPAEKVQNNSPRICLEMLGNHVRISELEDLLRCAQHKVKRVELEKKRVLREVDVTREENAALLEELAGLRSNLPCSYVPQKEQSGTDLSDMSSTQPAEHSDVVSMCERKSSASNLGSEEENKQLEHQNLERSAAKSEKNALVSKLHDESSTKPAWVQTETGRPDDGVQLEALKERVKCLESDLELSRAKAMQVIDEKARIEEKMEAILEEDQLRNLLNDLQDLFRSPSEQQIDVSTVAEGGRGRDTMRNKLECKSSSLELEDSGSVQHLRPMPSQKLAMASSSKIEPVISASLLHIFNPLDCDGSETSFTDETKPMPELSLGNERPNALQEKRPASDIIQMSQRSLCLLSSLKRLSMADSTVKSHCFDGSESFDALWRDSATLNTLLPPLNDHDSDHSIEEVLVAPEEDPAEAYYERLLKAVRVISAVTVRDRRHRFKTYRDCFVGIEAVDLLVASGCASTRKEAIHMCRRMKRELDLFEAVKNKHTQFSDDGAFFRFKSDSLKDALFMLSTGSWQ